MTIQARVLHLFRTDLRVGDEEVSLEKIDISHVGVTIRDIALSHRVIFHDTDEQTTMLKDRIFDEFKYDLKHVYRPLRMTYVDMHEYLNKEFSDYL